jgi:hypothetical protein
MAKKHFMGASMNLVPCEHENTVLVTDVFISDKTQGEPKKYLKCIDCGCIITAPVKPSKN